jgi:hypothetical protein
MVSRRRRADLTDVSPFFEKIIIKLEHMMNLIAKIIIIVIIPALSLALDPTVPTYDQI